MRAPLVLLWITLLAAPASAQEADRPPPPAGDRETTIRGHRAPGPTLTSPEAGQVVDTADAREESADMAALLDRTKGVMMRRSGGLGSPTTFYLNGFHGKRVRFFVDGVPAELDGLGLSPSDIPVDLIEHVEIYEGVVPIRFGADALGGAVNFVTRTIDDRPSLHTSLELASFGTFRGSTAGTIPLLPRLGLFARVDGFFDRTDNDYDVDVETPDERGQLQPVRVRRFHDGYAAHGLGARVGVRGQSWADLLTLGVFRSETAKDLQSNVRMTVPYGDITSGESATSAHLRYALSPRGENPFGVTFAGSVARRDGRFDDVSRNLWSWHGEVVAPRASPGERSAGNRVRRENLLATARLNLAYRIDGVQRLEVNSAVVASREERRTQLTIGADVPKAEVEYGQLRIVSGASWRLRPWGGRLENDLFVKHYFSNPDGPPGSGISASSIGPPSHDLGFGDGLRFSLFPWLHLKASYEWATRIPDPNELFGDGALIDTNPALLPESSHNVNVGLGTAGLETPLGIFDAAAGAFYRRTRDLIFLSVALDRAQYQNITDVDTTGVEAGLSWTGWGILHLGANVTVLSAVSRSKGGFFGRFQGDRIPNLPYQLGNLSASVDLRTDDGALERVRFYWFGRYVHQYFLFWESEGDPDHKLTIPSKFSQTAGVALTLSGHRLTASVEAQNLTGETLFDDVGTQLAGRSFHLKLIVGLD